MSYHFHSGNVEIPNRNTGLSFVTNQYTRDSKNTFCNLVPHYGLGFTGACSNFSGNSSRVSFAGFNGIVFMTGGQVVGAIDEYYGANLLLGGHLADTGLQKYMMDTTTRYARLHLEVQNVNGGRGESSTGFFINFYNHKTQNSVYGPNLLGSINNTSGSLSLSAASDYRIKDVIGPIDDALQKLIEVKPIYYFNKDNQEQIQTGVLAHEFAEIFPSYVIGEKDAVDRNGNMVVQQVSYSSIIPTLIAGIQQLASQVTQLLAENETIKAKVNVLEAQFQGV
jgi:hypothetical protein